MKPYQTSLNVGFDMASVMNGVDKDLMMAILRVVMCHIGSENKISRTELVAEVHAQGFKQDERTIRAAVSEMRRLYGIPVAGTGGKNGGYWILKDENEKNAYCQVQLHDPGISLLEQEAEVRKAFDRWHQGPQMRLGQ
jgi:hypothetical protein